MTAEMQGMVTAWIAAGFAEALQADCYVCGQDAGLVCLRMDSPQDLASPVLLAAPHAERVLWGAEKAAAALGGGTDTHTASDALIGDVVSRRLF